MDCFANLQYLSGCFTTTFPYSNVPLIPIITFNVTSLTPPHTSLKAEVYNLDDAVNIYTNLQV